MTKQNEFVESDLVSPLFERVYVFLLHLLRTRFKLWSGASAEAQEIDGVHWSVLGEFVVVQSPQPNTCAHAVNENDGCVWAVAVQRNCSNPIRSVLNVNIRSLYFVSNS